MYRTGLVARAIFLGLFGFGVALVASVGAGTVAPTQNDEWASFLIAGIPIAGVLTYDVGDGVVSATFFRPGILREFHREVETWSHYVNERMFFASRRALIGFLILLVGLQLPFVQQLPSPGLAILGVLIVAVALDRLRVGAVNAREIRENGERWLSAFWRTGNASLGATMLGVFVGAALFFLLNAGLSRFGL
jgi:hypothetical protein